MKFEIETHLVVLQRDINKPETQVTEKAKRAELNTLLEQEQVFWRQRSKINGIYLKKDIQNSSIQSLNKGN